jgi:long-chain fatty acid transport protein
MASSTLKARASIVLCAAMLASATPAHAQTASLLGAAGPINFSMAGASTAMPLDASGALYWNPATMRGLPGSEVDFGLFTLFPAARLSSSAAPGAFGPGIPSFPLAGSNTTDTGIVPVPNVAFVWQPPDSPWAYGLGISGLSGFASDYPANPANPIVAPPPPNGVGFGAIYSDYEVLQIAPSAAYQLSDRVSVGVSPIFLLGSLAAAPFVFAPPDNASGNGFPTYPSALHRHYAAGGAVQAGVYYAEPAGISLGAAVKSPQWFEPFRINAEDQLGRPRTVSTRIDGPMIVSVGLGYSGLEHFRFAVDFRFVDYADTDGFRSAGFDRAGALTGLGWNDVFVAAAGVQYAPGGPWSFRLGYSYNTNPIPNINTAFNVASSAIVQHDLYCGLSYQMTAAWTLSVEYGHGFKNSISGPIQGPLGPIPGTSVRVEGGGEEMTAGVRVQF